MHYSSDAIYILLPILVFLKLFEKLQNINNPKADTLVGYNYNYGVIVTFEEIDFPNERFTWSKLLLLKINI